MSDIITQNWVELMKVEKVDELAEYMIKMGIFMPEEVVESFSTDNEQHNKRMFFFAIQEKYHSASSTLIEWLKGTGEIKLAESLSKRSSGCIPFKPSIDEDKEYEEENDLPDDIPVDQNTKSLEINVIMAKEFYDTKKRNPNVQYYSSRSKQRGRVLIINNHVFLNNLRERRGAMVDEENLCKLFTDLGGWVIEKHQNKTAAEMRAILKAFTKYKKEKVCDICMVFIMSHGCELSNETLIYGTDSGQIRTSEIENYFSSSNCRLFRGKPKILIFQVCRGNELDQYFYLSSDTELDSAFIRPQADSESSNSTLKVYRSTEDTLIGFATLQGFVAHRDCNRGTWYIELICEYFMKLAHRESVDHLFMKVDEGLRPRRSEFHSSQTSESRNKGFRKLYLNPGIYEENNELKRF